MTELSDISYLNDCQKQDIIADIIEINKKFDTIRSDDKRILAYRIILDFSMPLTKKTSTRLCCKTYPILLQTEKKKHV